MFAVYNVSKKGRGHHLEPDKQINGITARWIGNTQFQLLTMVDKVFCIYNSMYIRTIYMYVSYVAIWCSFWRKLASMQYLFIFVCIFSWNVDVCVVTDCILQIKSFAVLIWLRCLCWDIHWVFLCFTIFLNKITKIGYFHLHFISYDSTQNLLHHSHRRENSWINVHTF
jgi:hypothetical protein